MKDHEYYTIHSWMTTEMKLKGTELLVYANIYAFSRDGKSEYRGGVETLMDWTGTSRRTVSYALKGLEEKKLIERVKFVSNGVQYHNYKVVLQPMRKNCAEGGAKIAHSNNTLYSNIEKTNRESAFRKRVSEHNDKYSVRLLKDFCDYWTESSENGTKLRFEMQKTFDLGRRLARWAKNDPKHSEENLTEEQKLKLKYNYQKTQY